MTYLSRMFFRLYAPATCVAASGAALASVGRSLGADAADAADAAGSTLTLTSVAGYALLLLAAALVGLASLRLLRWKSGAVASCFVCGCLLQAERESRHGISRRCTGCGKIHARSGLIRAMR
ncbi:hypothetical protein [Pinirhizobacter soli]|uniref:hypothetical protein n=1 Tax=Pinirhizobacter soli TaxID=2786953 RepID=UPI00202A35D5|nr:hypothetical protein [Pinirhizobacter soli]